MRAKWNKEIISCALSFKMYSLTFWEHISDVTLKFRVLHSKEWFLVGNVGSRKLEITHYEVPVVPRAINFHIWKRDTVGDEYSIYF